MSFEVDSTVVESAFPPGFEAGLRYPDSSLQDPRFTPYFTAPNFYGLRVPLPLSGFERDAEGDFSPVSFPSAEEAAAPGEYGLYLSLYALLGDEEPCPDVFTPEGWTPVHHRAALEVYGKAPVITVCAPPDQVYSMVQAYFHALWVSSGDAQRRFLSSDIVSEPLRDDLTFQRESAVLRTGFQRFLNGERSVKALLNPEVQKAFVQDWQALLPDSFVGLHWRPWRLVDADSLNALVASFYNYTPSAGRARLANLDHVYEAERKLAPEDLFVRSVEDDPEQALRCFVEWLLPKEVSPEPLLSRMQSKDPAWVQFLQEQQPDYFEKLSSANRFSLDQLRQVVRIWGIDCSETELHALGQFLNGRTIEDRLVLEGLLKNLLLHCRTFANRVGRRVGPSSGAVLVAPAALFSSKNSWGALLQEVSAAGHSDSAVVLPTEEGQGNLFRDLERLKLFMIQEYGLPFAPRSNEGILTRPSLSGSPTQVVDFLIKGLTGYQDLARQAYRRNGFTNRFSDESEDRLAVSPNEVMPIRGFRRSCAESIERVFGFLALTPPPLLTQSVTAEEGNRRIQSLLDGPILDRVAGYSTRADFLHADPSRQRMSVFRPTSGLVNAHPYSALRFLFRRLLPAALRDRFFRLDPVRGRPVEVTSARDYWRYTLGDAAIGTLLDISDSDGFLERAPLLTEAHLRLHGLIDLFELSPEEIPVALDLWQGRLQQPSEVADRLVERWFLHFQDFLTRIDGSEMDIPPLQRSAVVVFGLDDMATDPVSGAFLKRYLARCSESPDFNETAPLVVMSLPNLNQESRLGLNLLSTQFFPAIDAFLESVHAKNASRMVSSWNEVHRLGIKIAQHPDSQSSQRILKEGFNRVLSSFGHSGMDDFWQDIRVRRDRASSPKAISSVFQLLMQSFLSISQQQAQVALQQGHPEHGQMSLGCLDQYAQYMEMVQSRADFGICPFEKQAFLLYSEGYLRLLIDACLVMKKPIRSDAFANKRVAADHYRSLYHKLIGADVVRERMEPAYAEALLASLPLGVYADAVCAYLRGEPEGYDSIIRSGKKTFFAETNEGYHLRLREFLQESAPFMLESPGKIGMAGYALVFTTEVAVRTPVAILVMESLYQRCTDPDLQGQPEALEELKLFYQSLVALFPQLAPEFDPATVDTPATFWDYQLLLTAEHFAREVLLDLDAAEGHRRAAQEVLRDRPSYDPEYLRVSRHFRAEIDRARFEQDFIRVQEAVAAGGVPGLPLLQESIDSLMRALQAERNLLDVITLRLGELGEMDDGLRVPEGHVVEYRCTEFQLLIHLKNFMLFMDPIFQQENYRMLRAGLFHGQPGTILHELDFLLERTSRELQVLLQRSNTNYRRFWADRVVLGQCLRPAASLTEAGGAFWSSFIRDWEAFSELEA